jgi:hypothetical protein
MTAILPMENSTDQIRDRGVSGGDRFIYQGRGLDIPRTLAGWYSAEVVWNQFSPRPPATNNTTIVGAGSISASPEAGMLRIYLEAHRQTLETAAIAVPRRMSILDFPPLDLGNVLRPLGPDDDLLGEMLDEARS